MHNSKANLKTTRRQITRSSEVVKKFQLPCSSDFHKLHGEGPWYTTPLLQFDLQITAPVNWEQQMPRQSCWAHSTTQEFCMTKLKQSGLGLSNSHLTKFTPLRKGGLFLLLFHPNTSQCVQAKRLPEEIQQVQNEYKSQCISGQLCDTEGWTKLRGRVTTASKERQLILRETCQLHCPLMALHMAPDDNRKKGPEGLTGCYSYRQERVKGKSTSSITSFKAICLNRCSASLNWMIHPRGWPAAL